MAGMTRLLVDIFAESRASEAGKKKKKGANRIVVKKGVSPLGKDRKMKRLG